ncbi:MAG: hypothetical protein P4M12_06655 [Gammaproteobacteria bacterium]|nr:hypothetical protein [Gammaproteobacteria bacterium]
MTDCSDRTFKGITAFQYAVWARDRHMIQMMMKYLSKDEALAQIEKLNNMPKYQVDILPEDESTIEYKKNVIYCKRVEYIKNGEQKTGLEYHILNPKNEMIVGRIDVDELNHWIRKPLTLEQLKGLLPGIINITTARGHTIGYGPRYDPYALVEAHKNFRDINDQQARDSIFVYEIGWYYRYMPIAWLQEVFYRNEGFIPASDYSDAEFILQRQQLPCYYNDNKNPLNATAEFTAKLGAFFGEDGDELGRKSAFYRGNQHFVSSSYEAISNEDIIVDGNKQEALAIQRENEESLFMTWLNTPDSSSSYDR